MKKFVKWLLLFVLLLLIGITTFLYFFDANQYKGNLEEVISSSIEGKAHINNIHLSLFPYIGFYSDNLHITNKENKNALQIGSLSLRLQFKSLFYFKIVAALVLEDTTLNIPILQQILPESEEKSDEPISLEQLMAEHPWLNKLRITELRLNNLTLQDQETTLLKQTNFSLSPIQIADPTEAMRLLFETIYNDSEITLTTDAYLDAGKKMASLKAGVFSLGKSRFDFSGNVDGSKREPQLTFNMHGEEIGSQDLNILFPMPGTLTGTEMDFSLSGPLSQLQALGELHIEQIDYEAHRLKNTELDFKARLNDRLTLNTFKTYLYSGTAEASGFISIPNQQPYDLDVKVLSIALEEMTDMASGRFSLTTQAQGEKLDQNDVVHSLQATGRMVLTDGRVHTANLAAGAFSKKIANLISAALTKANGPTEIVLPGKNVEGTPFRFIEVPFKLANGKFIVEKLHIEYQEYEAYFSGYFNVEQQIDLKGRVLFTKERAGQTISDPSVRKYFTDSEERLIAPVRITGTFSKPLIRPDEDYFVDIAQKIAADLLQKQLKEKTMPKVEEQLQKIAPPQVEEKVKKFFKSPF